jgi:hypothetical protein
VDEIDEVFEMSVQAGRDVGDGHTTLDRKFVDDRVLSRYPFSVFPDGVAQHWPADVCHEPHGRRERLASLGAIGVGRQHHTRTGVMGRVEHQPQIAFPACQNDRPISRVGAYPQLRVDDRRDVEVP